MAARHRARRVVGCAAGRSCFDLVHVWRNDGARGLRRGPPLRTLYEIQTARVADMDLDGRKDIVCVGFEPLGRQPEWRRHPPRSRDGTFGGIQNSHCRGPSSRDPSRDSRR